MRPATIIRFSPSTEQMEDVRSNLASQGLEAAASTPDEFRSMIKAELAQWTRLVRDAHITAN